MILMLVSLMWEEHDMSQITVRRLAAVPCFARAVVSLAKRPVDVHRRRRAVPQFDVLDVLLGKDLQADTASKNAKSQRATVGMSF